MKTLNKRIVENPRTPNPRGKVRTFLNLFNGLDKVLVLINPDPDSMASALAVKRLLWRHVHEVVIAFVGSIQRLENQAMMEILKIPMVPTNRVESENFSKKVLVDSQPHHHRHFERRAYDAIVDHHPKTKELHASFLDIRPGYGANSTILIEYLRGAHIEPSTKLATALLYGIKTDTRNFERDATEEDVKQFRYVFHYANMNLLNKIEKSQLRLSDLKLFKIALERRVVTRKGLYAHLGRVNSPDICVQIADFFMRVYGMGWSFVSGIHGDKLIVIIRSDAYRKDAGKLAARAFGDVGSAGGHRGAARAEIPLNILQQRGIRPNDKRLEDFVKRCIHG
jgi:nanoRNase/pAp phosphatase (c-di-AMP/oligoRNAs hydrolase)